MKVKDIMTRKVLSVEPTVSVLQAVDSMLQNRISGLPVVGADGTLVGMVTEGDFLRRTETATERRRPRWLEFLVGPGRLAGEYVHTHARKIGDVMTPDPYTVTEDTSLEDVVQLMEKHRIKRLPVVRGKLLVGIVSRANLLHALASLARSAPAPLATDEAIRERLLKELDQQKWAPIAFLTVVVSRRCPKYARRERRAGSYGLDRAGHWRGYRCKRRGAVAVILRRVHLALTLCVLFPV
jgi:CBS domain-containing protein